MEHIRFKTIKHAIIALVTVIFSLILQGQVGAQDPEGEIIAEAPLTQVVAIPGSNVVKETTDYTIKFKTAVTGTIKTVEMVFSAGFDLTNAKFIEADGIGGVR